MTAPTLYAIERLRADVGELLASHRDTRGLGDLTRYATDPVGFAEQVLHTQPWSLQRTILEAVRDRPLVSVAGANGVGKGVLLAILAHWGVYACRAKVLLLSASQRQASEVLMRGEVLKLFVRGRLPGHLGVERLELLDGTTGLLAFTTTDVSRAGGYHDGRVIVLCDEAQGLEDWAFEGMQGNAVGDDDRVVLVGNPLLPDGTFARSFRPGTPWTTFRIPARLHPNINRAGGEPFIVGGPTWQWIEKMAAEYGPGSTQYRARVEAEFPTEGTDALFPRDLLAAAAQRWQAPNPNGHATVMAVDPARGGNETAVAVRVGDVLGELTAFRERDTQRALDAVGVIGLRWGITPYQECGSPNRFIRAKGQIVVDCCGLGGPLADALRRRGYDVLEFNGGHKPNRKRDSTEYHDMNAQAAFELHDRLRTGRLALPPGPDLVKLTDELTATLYRTTPVGKLAIEAKDDVAAKLGRSPDRRDAVLMCFATVTAYSRGTAQAAL